MARPGKRANLSPLTPEERRHRMVYQLGHHPNPIPLPHLTPAEAQYLREHLQDSVTQHAVFVADQLGSTWNNEQEVTAGHLTWQGAVLGALLDYLGRTLEAQPEPDPPLAVGPSDLLLMVRRREPQPGDIIPWDESLFSHGKGRAGLCSVRECNVVPVVGALYRTRLGAGPDGLEGSWWALCRPHLGSYCDRPNTTLAPGYRWGPGILPEFPEGVTTGG